MIKLILTSTIWLTLSQLFNKFILFGYSIFLARSLGVAEFGVYSFSVAWLLLASVVADFGLSRYFIKDSITDNKKIPEMVGKVIVARLGLSILAMFLVLVVVIFDQNLSRGWVLMLCMLTLIPQIFSVTWDNLLTGAGKFWLLAVIQIISMISTVVMGVFLVLYQSSAAMAILAIVINQIIMAGGVYWWLKPKWDWPNVTHILAWTELWKGSLPYGIMALLGLIYFRIDSILLGLLKGNFEVGIYGVGYKVLEAIVFIPTSLAVVLFPSLVKLHQINSEKITKLVWQIVGVMFSLGVLIAGLIYLVLPLLVIQVLPAYQQSIEVIKILVLSIPWMFVHIPLAQVLLSSDRYLRRIIGYSLLPVTVNIVLNLIYIPVYGVAGAAWISVLSDVLSALIIGWLVMQVIKDRKVSA